MTAALDTQTSPCRVTLVHDRDDTITATFATLEAATTWVTAEEGRRHPHHSVFNADFTSQSDDAIQHGTDYHWVTFEPVPDAHWPLPDPTNQPAQSTPPVRPVTPARVVVAEALHRRHQIIEGTRKGHTDPEVYAGWHPWDNLGINQTYWLELADTAIAALNTNHAHPENPR